MEGILIIDKPAGMTSHDVVARARRILRERRIGHTGTLDPFATGVLVVLVGRATRLAQFLGGAEKVYDATTRFGYSTDTGDLTGSPRPESYGWRDFTANELETALASLRGAIQQTPPMYSAKKVQGKKLYELARAGQEIERRPVGVTVSQFEAQPREKGLYTRNDDETADLDVTVCCSAGTYIRVLAEDLGARLGLGAHLTRLRRTRAGAFSLAQAVTLDQLEEQGAKALLPMSLAVAGWPSRRLNDEEKRRVSNGQAVSWLETPLPDGQNTALFDEPGQLVAVASYDAAANSLRPRIVLLP